MVEEELEQLELSVRENDLFSLVAQHPTIGIEPQPLELPDPLIPEVEAYVVPLHLGLDENREAVFLLADQLRACPTEAFVTEVRQVLAPEAVELR